MSRILYLGLKVPATFQQLSVQHLPLIYIQPRSLKSLRQVFKSHFDWTHLVFTSQTAVNLFFEACQHFGLYLSNKKIVAVGKATAASLKKWGLEAAVPQEETAEGILLLDQTWKADQAYFFWPHSALSRPVLTNYWQCWGIRYQECVLYETYPNYAIPLPSLDYFDEIIFTSPSTVDAFVKRYGSLPPNKKLTPIGPITADYLAAVKK